jgi:hypothetical protein
VILNILNLKLNDVFRLIADSAQEAAFVRFFKAMPEVSYTEYVFSLYFIPLFCKEILESFLVAKNIIYY